MSPANRRPRPTSAAGTRHDVPHRDAGLNALARVNRWMVAGSLALAGGASVVTWHAFEAHAAGLVRSPPSISAPAPATPAPAVSGGS